MALQGHWQRDLLVRAWLILVGAKLLLEAVSRTLSASVGSLIGWIGCFQVQACQSSLFIFFCIYLNLWKQWRVLQKYPSYSLCPKESAKRSWRMKLPGPSWKTVSHMQLRGWERARKLEWKILPQWHQLKLGKWERTECCLMQLSLWDSHESFSWNWRVFQALLSVTLSSSQLLSCF